MPTYNFHILNRDFHLKIINQIKFTKEKDIYCYKHRKEKRKLSISHLLSKYYLYILCILNFHIYDNSILYHINKLLNKKVCY